MIAMIARDRDQMMPGDMRPPEGAGGNPLQPPIDKNALTGVLVVSGVLIAAGITIALLFKRRRYDKA